MTAVSILIVGVGGAFIFLFNGLILKRNVVDNAQLLVDGWLKKRCDLASELAAATQEQLAQEGEAFASLTAFRRTATLAEKAERDKQLNDVWQRLMGQIAQQSELNTDGIRALQEAFREAETQRQAACERYNQVAANFNRAIQTPPGSFFAKMMKLVPREPFPVLPEADRGKSP